MEYSAAKEPGGDQKQSWERVNIGLDPTRLQLNDHVDIAIHLDSCLWPFDKYYSTILLLSALFLTPDRYIWFFNFINSSGKYYAKTITMFTWQSQTSDSLLAIKQLTETRQCSFNIWGEWTLYVLTRIGVKTICVFVHICILPAGRRAPPVPPRGSAGSSGSMRQARQASRRRSYLTRSRRRWTSAGSWSDTPSPHCGLREEEEEEES